MALTDPQREQVWKEFMSLASHDREDLPLTKDELRAALNAIDTWMDDNLTSFNTAIPVAARSALTTKQKVRLFQLALKLRWEVS